MLFDLSKPHFLSLKKRQSPWPMTISHMINKVCRVPARMGTPSVADVSMHPCHPLSIPKPAWRRQFLTTQKMGVTEGDFLSTPDTHLCVFTTSLFRGGDHMQSPTLTSQEDMSFPALSAEAHESSWLCRGQGAGPGSFGSTSRIFLFLFSNETS